MSTRLRKHRKLRGRVSAGYGRVGKHRKMSGGRGMAGGEHHRRTWMTRYHPEYFGKFGQVKGHRNISDKLMRHINVEKLWSLVPESVRDDVISGKMKDAVVVDITKFGYWKVLSRGTLYNKVPLVVKAKVFSDGAKAKITSGGGECVQIP
eukprot:Trichotokara_eunicae@DN4321_c0_g1_i2.p1